MTTEYRFNSDREALDVLKEHYGIHLGIIYPLDPTHVLTEIEAAALRELLREWDYDYKSTKPISVAS